MIGTDIVVKSFKKTGIEDGIQGNALDATEDHLVWDDDVACEADEATTSDVSTDSD